LAIRDVLRNGRVTKEIKLARTEREYIYHSPALSTSMKKLTRLMHLIAGKTIEEALIQLRFSPKRVARDVMKFLMVGRDEAVTQRGMGIGGAQAAREAFQRELENMSAKKGVEWTPYLADGTRRLERKPEEGRLIEMKDGSQKRIYDETEIYISQAWVTKGQHSKSIEQRARGQVNVLKHQTTSTYSAYLPLPSTPLRQGPFILTPS
jgi:ribosomal protein L22